MTIARENPSTTVSRWMFCALGRSRHLPTSHSVAANDNSTPVTPPAIDTSRLSTSCSRISVILCGAKRPSDGGDLPLPRRGPCHQQVGHIEAADEQHTDRRA